MPSIETYRKQAKLLVRWHRERNYSVGEKLRQLQPFRHLTDLDVLDMKLSLTLAQEIVAVEAGFTDWAALRAGAGDPVARPVESGEPVCKTAVPILFVRDVTAAANFYAEKLGFTVAFLHGKPPFYAALSRDHASLHLRYVQNPNFRQLAERETSLILATIETDHVNVLFQAFLDRGVDFAQTLTKQAWGGTDFHVRDPDGNVISFVQFSTTRT